jgi:hypothetical protein
MVGDEQGLERNDGSFFHGSAAGRRKLSDPQELPEMRSEIGGSRRVLLLAGQLAAAPLYRGGKGLAQILAETVLGGKNRKPADALLQGKAGQGFTLLATGQ